jgi:hypothetical protein
MANIMDVLSGKASVTPEQAVTQAVVEAGGEVITKPARRDSFTNVGVPDIKTIRDETDKAYIPWNVEHHPNYIAFWGSEISISKLKSVGYGFVYEENLVTHFDDLAEDEVRILYGDIKPDGTGRIRRKVLQDEPYQYLMLSSKVAWENNQREKARRRSAKIAEGFKDSNDLLLSQIKDPSKRDFLEEKMAHDSHARADSNFMD